MLLEFCLCLFCVFCCLTLKGVLLFLTTCFCFCDACVCCGVFLYCFFVEFCDVFDFCCFDWKVFVVFF